jgi:hypothetical protein
MHMYRTVLAIAVALAILGGSGCVTDDGTTTSGWVVIGDQNQSPHRSKQEPDKHSGKGKGHDNAARNHIHSAYRFLKKDKPDHALRELEKARSKMDRNFWYHYYRGGAFYMKGMYTQARDSWELAYRFTRDYRYRSRIRTCQSFVVFRIQGYQSSVGFLHKAVDMDRDNRTAKGLLDDLLAGQDNYRNRDDDRYDTRQHSDERETSSSEQPAFVKDLLGNSKYGDKDEPSRDGGRDDDRYSDKDRDRDQYDDDDRDNDRSDDRDNKGNKDKKYKNDKDDKGKDNKYKGKSKKPAKKPRKPYRVEDDGRFRAYFYVQMP